jgi:hypothetical protein
VNRSSVDKEIAYSLEVQRSRTVRTVTLQRVLAVADEKTEALKLIHREINKLLDADEVSQESLKRIRSIASGAWPKIAPVEGTSDND